MSRRAKGASGEGSGRRRELESLLGELVETAAGGGTDHPEPGRLLDYHEGRLPAAEEAALQDHLAACPACAALLLDLDAFAAAAAFPEESVPGERVQEDSAPEESAPADFATATAWRALAPRLDEEAPGEAARRPPARRPAAGSGRFPAGRWLPALAASLLVAVPVLTVLLVKSQQRVSRLEGALTTPQTGVPVLYLDPLTREEAEGAPALALPPGDGFFLLTVTPPAGGLDDRYRVEIVNPAGRVVWEGKELAASDHGTLRLGFTRRALPPGAYRLRLYGPPAGELLATHPFTVRAR